MSELLFLCKIFLITNVSKRQRRRCNFAHNYQFLGLNTHFYISTTSISKPQILQNIKHQPCTSLSLMRSSKIIFLHGQLLIHSSLNYFFLQYSFSLCASCAYLCYIGSVEISSTMCIGSITMVYRNKSVIKHDYYNQAPPMHHFSLKCFKSYAPLRLDFILLVLIKRKTCTHITSNTLFTNIIPANKSGGAMYKITRVGVLAAQGGNINV